jgi:two-component system, NarL family, response regulator NreC
VTLTIVLADDHQIVRQGLQAILGTEADLQVVGAAATGLEAIRLVERLRPNVLVLDLMLPGQSGFEVARRVIRLSPQTRIVVLSMHANEAYVVEALRAGAHAYVLKDEGARELVTAIREASAGRRYLSASLSEEALRAYGRREAASPVDPYETLTRREREVLQMTVEGQSGTQIAARLFISPRTVETHRANVMRKLGVRNQKDLVRYAVQRNLSAEEQQLRTKT